MLRKLQLEFKLSSAFVKASGPQIGFSSDRLAKDNGNFRILVPDKLNMHVELQEESHSS